MLSGFSLSKTAIVANELSKMHQQSGSSHFSAYGERPQMGLDVEYGQDLASGAAFFQTDGRKHDDLKQMLDSNKDGLKLEAMKRIIGMIAKGRDASSLFPAVVKNVVSKNIEIKKLVYVYLVRYAEEEQDLALLSISTFQRALKDPNQLIRASALRVLSSIRVGMIAPIVMLAIKESASDMSAYVRKTAAHAIPKLYSVDPELKQELVSVIEKLLSDRTTLVVGSAVMAFDEVCPERVDLIHKNYRKLCNLLIDVDEWGQVIIINMLTRYARTQFLNPNPDELDLKFASHEQFYDESSSSSDDNESTLNDTSKRDHERRVQSSPTRCYIDMDHRLLLRQAKPLLQSRNASVVMSVAQLYHHIAPNNEVQIVAKALVRLLRLQKEIQSIVLTCIASITIKRKRIFEPHIKTFFVRSSDATHLKILKLDILTNLASSTTIGMILREFQTYISSSDRTFVASTIQAIGRCAASIKEVTEICLNGLVHLLSNRDEHVVAESVVVIKKLLQGKSAKHYDIISQMAKLIDFITVAAARASIIWLIGEYNNKVPKIAPDVLRKMAKTFVDEANIVKLQILNLAVKLYITNPEQISLLCQYVFNLARYDTNYDIRDRARFLRHFIYSNKNTILTKNIREIFLSTKPAPSLESKYCGHNLYQLGSLSHYLNLRATGYQDLPTFPLVQPDSSVRNIEGYANESSIKSPTGATLQQRHTKNNKSSEYSDSDSSSSSSSSEESTDSEEEKSESKKNKKLIEHIESIPNKFSDPFLQKKNNVVSSDTESSSDCGSETDSDIKVTSHNNASSSESERMKEIKPQVNKRNAEVINKTASKNDIDLLFDLDDLPSIVPIMTPSLEKFSASGNLKNNSENATRGNINAIDLAAPSYIDEKYEELVNKMVGNGLQINYRYTRSPHLFSGTMISIEMQFINKASININDIQMIHGTLPTGMQLREFTPIRLLMPAQMTTSTLGIDFNDSTYAVDFEISSSIGKAPISLKPKIGELIRSVQVTETFFKEERMKLRGMNENHCRIRLSKHNFNFDLLKTIVCQRINVAPLSTSEMTDVYYFAGQTMSSKNLVLITLDWQSASDGNELLIIVNCEKMVIGSVILNELRNCFSTLLLNQSNIEMQ